MLFIRALASLKFSFTLLLALLLALLIAYNFEQSFLYWLILPFVLLVLNLAAAIVCNKKFQANIPLLFFHLSLLATVVLAGLSRLTYLDGRVSLHEGGLFDGKLHDVKQGLWHQYNLSPGMFSLEAVELAFTNFIAITDIKTRIRLYAEEKPVRELVIGEHKPLVINNYRFYSTSNIGYSAVLSWQNIDQLDRFDIATGSINFPPYLINEFSQTNTWQVPNSERQLWFMLSPDNDLLTEQKAMKLTPPKYHSLVIRDGEQRYSLRVGEQLKLAEGVLTYQGLRTWAGFSVHYEPFKAYLLASSLLSVFCLSWFYWQRFNRRSWLDKL
ncbi:cytochrome c biogenesis protein ResB [Thalassotalea aquiviva]|uniref:cytochrome c biogenesis protein ResB n=1 Tax=Thalassotalea aquiviva TaxID=3242415 RepID=UPI00352A8403